MTNGFDAAPLYWDMLWLILALLQPLLWVSLLIVFLLATAHLLTMFVTRWGDRRVSGKSLVFSVIVHFACAIGLISLIPDYRQFTSAAVERRQPEEEFRVRTELIEQPQQQRDDSGDLPLWDRIEPAWDQELARREPIIDQFEPDTPSERPVAEVPQQPIAEATPEPTPREESAPAAPLVAQAGPQPQAEMPLPVEEPELQPRPEANVPSATRQRSPQLSQADRSEDAAPTTLPGSVDRLKPELDPDRQNSALPAVTSPDAPLPEADDAGMIARREGPAPSELNVEQAGEETLQQPTPSAAGSPDRPQVARTRSRLPQSMEQPGPARTLPTSPQTERPADQPIDAQSPSRSTPSIAKVDVPNVDPPTSNRVTDSVPVPATYQLRTEERRKRATRQYGGNEASEQAVEQALRWLASAQESDGRWDAGRWGAGRAEDSTRTADRPNTGGDSDAGVTGLALLAYLGAGSTHVRGEYSDQVEAALDWLLENQRSDGYLGADASSISGMYCHGIATFALAEAYAMEQDEPDSSGLRTAVERALAYIRDSQLADGGWRYQRGQPDGDMSMFGWQLMALKSGELGGIPIPSGTRGEMINFLKDRSRGENDGLAGYRAVDPPTPAMTAEALFCKQRLGIRHDNPASIEAIDYLMENLPRRSRLNLYYWYYGTLATFQYGEAEWERWNTAVRDLLIAEQITEGELAGSWEPRGPWGPYGGRIYSTAISALCLEVYYRYLPLYRTSRPFSEADDRED